MAQHVERTAVQAGRWEGKPVQAAMLRAVVVAIPVGAGVLASVIFSRAVAYPRGAVAVVAWWIAALALSSIAVVIVERQCRRLLPLAALLKLSMIFPDKAPSRYGVALRAGTVRNLEERVADMHARGIDDEPSRAARQILELVGALAVHDRGTRGHAERVRAYADLLGAQIGLTQDDRDRLRWAALLHDVGKVAVPSELLNKPGAPDEAEWEVIHRHPEEGAKLAGPLRHWLGEWADTIEQHHERWDGLGYPNHLKGEQIVRGARIVAVADAFEVMTAARSYKRPMDVKAARQELTNGAGTQFDPAMVRAFLMISLGRMRWMVGPLAWVAQLPFLQGIPGGFAGQAAATGGRVLAGAALFTGLAGPAVSASGASNHDAALERSHEPAATTAPGSVSAGDAAGAGGGPTTVAAAVGTSATTRPAATTATPPPTAAPRPNVPPVVQDDAATTTEHKPVPVPVLANDRDPDADAFALPVTIVTPAAHGNANPQSNGSVLYVPNDQYVGSDSFIYRVCDTRGGCATASVWITVLGDPTTVAPVTTTTAKGGNPHKP